MNYRQSSCIALLAIVAVLAGCSRDLQLAGEGLEPETGEISSATEAAEVRTVNVVARLPQAVRDELVCTEEIKTGSHHDREYCMTRSQRRAMRQAAQDWLRSGGWQGSAVVVR